MVQTDNRNDLEGDGSVMEKQLTSEDVLKGMVYQKPEIKREKVMTFMFDALKKMPTKISCRQCSSCHGCR